MPGWTTSSLLTDCTHVHSSPCAPSLTHPSLKHHSSLIPHPFISPSLSRALPSPNLSAFHQYPHPSPASLYIFKSTRAYGLRGYVRIGSFGHETWSFERQLFQPKRKLWSYVVFAFDFFRHPQIAAQATPAYTEHGEGGDRGRKGNHISLSLIMKSFTRYSHNLKALRFHDDRHPVWFELLLCYSSNFSTVI